MKKIALIGIGKMGMSHLAIAKQTPGLEVKAVCDTSKALLRVLSKNTNLDCYSDYKKMISEATLDAVMVLVPNLYHFEVVKYCLEKGLHVFVEKPFTLNYEQSKILVELAARQQLKGQVGYVNRFNPVFQKVRKLLDQKVIGRISHYINRMTGGVILNENNTGWRNDYEKGGGCLFDYGPHCFDLATYFFGTEAEVRSAVLKRIFSTRVDDMVYATLIHKDGITGFNYINWSDSSVRKATNSIEIMGTKGKIVAGKQECSLFLTEDNMELGYTKGWNQLYVTDVPTDVPYYLRGEEFSRQLLEFSDLVNGKINTSVSSLESGSITDKIIRDIKELNGALI
jgi:predicted dehydrogenase